MGFKSKAQKESGKESAYNSQSATREASRRCPLQSPSGAALSVRPACRLPVLPALVALAPAPQPARPAGASVSPSAKAARSALHSRLCPLRSPRGPRRHRPFSEALATPAPFPQMLWTPGMLWGQDRRGPCCHESPCLQTVGIENLEAEKKKNYNTRSLL